jgi:hypothetical protein
MKKVVLASLLACASVVTNLPSRILAQSAPAACPPMADAEYKSYNDAISATDPKAKAAAIEAYLSAFPQSCVKLPTMIALMQTYSLFDAAKTLDAADRVLQLDPTSLQALYAEALLRRQTADALTDASAKQAALDVAAGYGQKGLTAPKPASMSDDAFKQLQAVATPAFLAAVADAALQKKDTATAIANFKKELTSVPEPQTHNVPLLPDTYQLALAYMQSTPPDYLNCAFYASRFVALAPEPFKSQIAPSAKYCYKRYHGGDDGYDAVLSVAQANVTPPADFATSVKPAPTPAEQIHGIIASTSDLSQLATSDKEMVFQYGSSEDAAKVWDTMKGKSVEIPGSLVIASTPTQLQVAVSEDAVQSKTADFTFTLKAPDPLPEKATAAQKAAYQKNLDAIAEATRVGKTVTLDGTYDSFTPKPLMITMTDGEVALPKAKPTTKPSLHRPAPKKQ